MSDYILKFKTLGGIFDENTNEGVVTNPNLIRTKDIQKLCDALTKGFNLISLTFERY